MASRKDSIIRRLEEYPGHTSFYYKDLTTGESYAYNAEEPMCAASVIKLTVMAELFRQIAAGEVSRDQKIVVRDEDRVPICGVLTLLHTGLEVTPIDLCQLMITISDNMATNLLIDLLGVEKIEENNRRLDLTGVTIQRKLFEKRPEYQNKTNYISAAGIGKLLGMLVDGTLVSPQASKEMLGILGGQQCTNKMPLFLPLDAPIAHKTGEDDGISHDVGVVYAKQPFIACFCNWQLEQPNEVGHLNALIGQITRELYDDHGGLPEEA